MEAQFSQMRFVVVGDVMVDRYLYGQVRRISPEAPVPILELDREEYRLGGAANVAINLRTIGCRVELGGVIGRDQWGEAFQEEACRHGIEVFALVEDPARPTTTKTRLIAKSQHLLRVDREITNPITPELSASLLEKVRTLLAQRPHGLIFEDYDKGTLTPQLIRALTAEAQAQGVPVLVDPKKAHFWAYEGCTVFKPNLHELSEALGRPIDPTPESWKTALLELRARMPHQYTLLTLSEYGVFVMDERGETHYIPAHRRQIVDVSGAGDTVISVLAVGLALGLPISKAAALANLAGGLVCEYVGVVPVPREQWLAQARELGLL